MKIALALLLLPLSLHAAPVQTSDGDAYEVRGGAVYRVQDQFRGHMGSRLGPLERAFGVKTIVVHEGRLVALQDTGRLFVYGPLNGLSGAWVLIGVDAESVEVAGGKMLVTDKRGARLEYTGKISEDAGLGLRSSLVGTWDLPGQVFGNAVFNFKELAGPRG